MYKKLKDLAKGLFTREAHIKNIKDAINVLHKTFKL
jgi:hypothetical protein